MPSFRLAIRQLFIGAATLPAFTGLGLPCGLAHAQSNLTARYAISVAGVGIGEGMWSVEINKDRYATKASGSFIGIWRVLAGGDVSSAARGTASRGRLTPTSYEANFALDEDIDEVRMTLRDGVVKDVEVKPTLPALPDRVPVTGAHLRGVIDPLTSGLVPMPGTGDVLVPAACQRTLPIFDMALSFKRMDKVKAANGYEGPVVVCAMDYEPIAGHSPHGYRVKYLKGRRHMEMWLAPVGGTRLLAPFRISIPTLLGAAVLEATEFESAARPR